MTIEEIIDYQVDGLVDTDVSPRKAKKIIVEYIDTLKKSHEEQEIREYFTYLIDFDTYKLAKKMSIDKDVDKIANEIAKKYNFIR